MKYLLGFIVLCSIQFSFADTTYKCKTKSGVVFYQQNQCSLGARSVAKVSAESKYKKPQEGIIFSVPSDSRATYAAISMKDTRNGVELLTKRDASSGTSYSLTLFDCKGRFKYLGSGDTRAEAENGRADQDMSFIVSGSIKDYQSRYACS